jgi:hypothetical protein
MSEDRGQRADGGRQMMGVGGWGLEAVLCLKLKAECMQLIAGHSLIVIYLNFSNIEPLNPETSYETTSFITKM